VTVSPWAHWWLFGVPLALAVLVVLVVRSPERAALGGGALIPTGLWFLYELRAAVERCAELDRSPSGSCSIYGVNEQAIAMSLYVAVGIGLTAYAAFRRRPQPASGDPSAAAPIRR
jgi:hypothetical protein